MWAVQCDDRKTGNMSVRHGVRFSIGLACVWQDKQECNFGEISKTAERKM